MAKALQAKLSAIGIKPALDADSAAIVTQRQAQGDIEYLFAVNATPKPNGGKIQIQSADATLTVPADGRPIYDAVHGEVENGFKPADNHLSGKFRFGPGQMRVFARTARPIGGVQVQSPVLFRDFTVDPAPIRVESAATLLDDGHGVLSGSAPLQVRLIDPLGEVRYDLFRATDRGTLRLDLPLAANDPTGQWKLEVRELLSGKEGSATFDYQPATQCGAAAGATQRAVSFGDDRDHIFRLFRTHQDFTIIIGKGDYDAAVQRITESLRPWGARCKVMKASDVKVRQVSDPDAIRTWAGLSPGRPDFKNPNAAAFGFEVDGPAILLGTPENNEIIKFASEHGFLPYSLEVKKDPKAPKPAKGVKPVEPPRDFPGRGRGYIAWQRDAISYGTESVTLIGYDPAGISEAIGSFYEAVAALDPLTRYALPAPAGITPATTRTTALEATIAWQASLPDRILSVKIDGGQIVAETEDGSVTKVDANGKIVSRTVADSTEPAPSIAPKLPAEFEKQAVSGRVVKKIAADNGKTAIGYWGGTVQVIDAAGKTQSLQILANDIGDMAWLNGKLIVGLADGSMVSLDVK